MAYILEDGDRKGCYQLLPVCYRYVTGDVTGGRIAESQISRGFADHVTGFEGGIYILEKGGKKA